MATYTYTIVAPFMTPITKGGFKNSKDCILECKKNIANQYMTGYIFEVDEMGRRSTTPLLAVL